MSILILLILFSYSSFISNFPLKFYQHTFFESQTFTDRITTIPSIRYSYECVCKCREYSACLTGSHSANNQTCSLFSIYPEQGYLRLSFAQSDVVFTFINETINVPQAIQWDFNGDFNDAYGVYNGQLISQNRRKRQSEESIWINSIFNQGDMAIQFPSNSYCLIEKSLDLKGISFTITARISIQENFENDLQYFPLLFHCKTVTNSHCLHLLVEQQGVRLGFYGDDLVGQTPLNTNQWYHIAFVYIQSNSQQRVYVNGILDGNRTSTYPYQGEQHQVVLGPLPSVLSGDFLSGYIDKLIFVSHVKSEKEILDEATLVVYFKFDNSYEDIGPEKYDRIGIVSTTFYANGRFNQSLLFNSESDSFFQIYDLFYLGQVNYLFSISLWILPSSNSGTILQILSGETWCLPMLGFNSFGNLVAQTWNGQTIREIISPSSIPTTTYTHVALTYSPANGFRLFVNGTLIEYGFGLLNYVASGGQSTVTLGNCFQKLICPESTELQISLTQYQGTIDDFKIFSRELSPTDINELFLL